MRIDEIILNDVGPFERIQIALPKGTDSNIADTYLLTGSNGSGKSTILYAIAGAIGASNLGLDLGYRRFRTAKSSTFIRFGNYVLASGWRSYGDTTERELMDPFSGSKLSLYISQNHVGYFQSEKPPTESYARKVSNFDPNNPAASKAKFSWAAFAYAGMRSVSDAKVSAIQEPTYSPFEQSLSFVHTANTDRLAQWIANQNYKRLKAKDAGRLDRANQLGSSVRDIEAAISQIINQEFSFYITEDDNDVRVKRDGKVSDLGLLPDGLKAIVSWVADLLMRLDRIPWTDDTPPMKRSFLLLLDEVDIHLHPSWQRRILPIIQRIFPNAQIIASTHSPFVIASAKDAQIITLSVSSGVSNLGDINALDGGVSYSTVLRSIFGIESEFNVETEQLFKKFHEEKRRLLRGEGTWECINELAVRLSSQGDEVRSLVGIELRQLKLQFSEG